MIPLCALLLSCTTKGNLDIPQKTCMVAGIYVACDSIPKEAEELEPEDLFLNLYSYALSNQAASES